MIVKFKKKKTHTNCAREFQSKLPDTTCPSGDKISKLVKKVGTNSILIDRKPLLYDTGH
jgi:hypothetical protein